MSFVIYKMSNFLKKRLQVFISSTYVDLKVERQAAVSAILTSGHIPAGMELFTAGDQSQMEVIKQWIDESDVYLLILGSRYGSIEPETGKSYTHLEYEYALSKNKPLFACVIKDSAIDARIEKLGRMCLEFKNPRKLEGFRSLVLSKMSGFWSDTKDIELEVIKTLQTFSRREELIGWVKGDESVNTVALSEELARLSKENAELREQLLSQDKGDSSANTLGIPNEDMKYILESTNFPVSSLNAHQIKDLNSKFKLDIKSNKIHNLLSFFLLIRKPLSTKIILGSPGFSRPITDLLQNLSQYGLLTIGNEVLVSDGKAKITMFCYISESGYQFLNWLDLQKMKDN